MFHSIRDIVLFNRLVFSQVSLVIILCPHLFFSKNFSSKELGVKGGKGLLLSFAL